MHSAQIMHRDLKPSNILINADCDLKLCDFGLSRFFGEIDATETKTAYVVTRWYRAPEVSLLQKSYSQAIDLWSVGCIFGELLQRATLLPGETNANEVSMILKITGIPSDEDLSFIDNEQAMNFIQRQKKKILESGHQRPVDWKSRIPHASDDAIDLLKGLLTFCPEKRLTVEQAMNHRYFEHLRKVDVPPTCTETINWSWETELNNKKVKSIKEEQDIIRKLIYEESLSFHKEEKEEDEVEKTVLGKRERADEDDEEPEGPNHQRQKLSPKNNGLGFQQK